MDLFTSVRKAGALDRLAELEEQDAQLFAARAQALVDVEDVCRAQPDSDRAMAFVALDIATACDIAQITATARLTKAKHLIHDLPLTFEHLRRGQLRVGQAVALMEETKDLPATTCQAVEARALVTLYEPRGRFQLNVESMRREYVALELFLSVLSTPDTEITWSYDAG